MTGKTKSKTITTHPESRRKMKIESSVYESFKKAIIQSLKGSKGKTFAELTDHVIKIIRKTMPDFQGSIPWYSITIRLDLETRGIVETFVEKGKKLNRLKQ